MTFLLKLFTYDYQEHLAIFIHFLLKGGHKPFLKDHRLPPRPNCNFMNGNKIMKIMG